MVKKLDDEVKITGVGFSTTSTLLDRRGDICLYKRSDDVYEVFKVKVSPEREIFGKLYPERETYPSNEDFGKTAFCFKEEKNARRQFEVMLDNNYNNSGVPTDI